MIVLTELQINCAPGCRVYVTQRVRELIVLLAGVDKSTQAKDILLVPRVCHRLPEMPDCPAKESTRRAFRSAFNQCGPWWNSGASRMNAAFPKSFFDRLGLVSLLGTMQRLQCVR